MDGGYDDTHRIGFRSLEKAFQAGEKRNAQVLPDRGCAFLVQVHDTDQLGAEKFGVNPDTVHKEEIDKGQFIIEYEGGHKGISVDELEEAGYGRRSNCRRCTT